MKGSYFHIAVCMENLVGPERARKVIEWKQKDPYRAIYKVILDHRGEVEAILTRDVVRW
jgi:hypothetical protein